MTFYYLHTTLQPSGSRLKSSFLHHSTFFFLCLRRVSAPLSVNHNHNLVALDATPTTLASPINLLPLELPLVLYHKADSSVRPALCSRAPASSPSTFPKSLKTQGFSPVPRTGLYHLLRSPLPFCPSVSIALFSTTCSSSTPSPRKGLTEMDPKSSSPLPKTDEEWKLKLSPEQFRILRLVLSDRISAREQNTQF